jgi:hypothetical protein
MEALRIHQPEGRNVWHSVRRELACWADSGLRAKFWVRDDDAVEVSEELLRLRDIAAKYRIRIGLALIPGRVSPDLVNFLDRSGSQFYPMCHGWKHVNHNAKNSPGEFGADRPISSLITDARLALQLFSQLFGSAKAIFVPPFNNATPSLIKSLPNIGFFGVSLTPSYLERTLLKLSFGLNFRAPVTIPDLNRGRRIDVHVDLINWQAKTAHETGTIAGQILRQLRARRLGYLSADVPIGLLTHHLAHDERVWSLCQDVLSVLHAFETVEFLDVGKWADGHVAGSTARATSDAGACAT